MCLLCVLIVLYAAYTHATPTPAPTATPTSFPTPAAVTVPAVPCSNPTVYGIGSLLSNVTCSTGGVCSAPTLLGCVNGTINDPVGGRACSMYLRRCTVTELAAQCGTAESYLGNQSCWYRCSMETDAAGRSACVFHNKSCAVAGTPSCFVSRDSCEGISRTAPPACEALCGANVQYCDWQNTTLTRAQACICPPHTLGVGNATRGAPDDFCRVQGEITVPCSYDDAYQYCGIEFSRGCQRRLLWVSQELATAWNAWEDGTRNVTEVYPSIFSQCFTVTTVSFYHQHRLRSLAQCWGLTPIWFVECECTDPLTPTQWVRHTVLPNPAERRGRMPLQRYRTRYRFRYFTCGASPFTLSFLWRDANDWCPTTTGGPCNRHGTCTPTTQGNGDCGTASREAAFSQYLTWLDNPADTSFMVIDTLLIGASHYLLDFMDTTQPTWVDVGQSLIGCFFGSCSYNENYQHLDLPAQKIALLANYRDVVSFAETYRDSQPFAASAQRARYAAAPATPFACEAVVRNTSFWCDPFNQVALTSCALAMSNFAFHPPLLSNGVNYPNLQNPLFRCWGYFQNWRRRDIGTNFSLYPNIPHEMANLTSTELNNPSQTCGANSFTCFPISHASDRAAVSATRSQPYRLQTANRCMEKRYGANRTSMCACDTGWMGAACQYRVSTGAIVTEYPLNRADGCGNGTFNATRQTCVCNTGIVSLTYAPCNTARACPSSRWGANCSNSWRTLQGTFSGYDASIGVPHWACQHGTLVQTGYDLACVCDEGWTGEFCQLSACPVDPLTGAPCFGRATCRRTATGHTCLSSSDGTEAATIGFPATCPSIESCKLNGTITNASGCACQFADRTAGCVDPAGPAGRLCSTITADRPEITGVNPNCAYCLRRNATNGVEVMGCACPVGYRGPYCQWRPCGETAGATACSGRGALGCNIATNTCLFCPGASFQSGGSGAEPFATYAGQFCETDVSTTCGVAANDNANLFGYVQCNGPNYGNCTRGANGTYGCVCRGDYTTATMCRQVGAPTPTPTATPSRAPTAAPTATPTATPTAVPTYANFTLLNVTFCTTRCLGGFCRFLPGQNATCVCPEPRVRSYNNVTGDCDLNQCPNMSYPNANGTLCICANPTQISDYAPNGPCRTQITCTLVDGHVCGQRSVVEVSSVDIGLSTFSKTCTDGVCSCSGPYRLNATSGLCEERCNPTRTTAYTDRCVCVTGWNSTTDCYAVECPARQIVDPDDPTRSTCICRPTTTGTDCAFDKCQNGTLAADYSCQCSSAFFSGSFCERSNCSGTLQRVGNNYSCVCPVGGGWGGPTCAENLCLNGGQPDALGHCNCTGNTTQNRYLCNASAPCVTNANAGANNTCPCKVAWADAQCAYPYCVNGAVRQNGTCICWTGYSGARCDISTAATPRPSALPTGAPTPAPTPPTRAPTRAPTAPPTLEPSSLPTTAPTFAGAEAVDGPISPLVVGATLAAAAALGAGVSALTYYRCARKPLHLDLR